MSLRRIYLLLGSFGFVGKTPKVRLYNVCPKENNTVVISTGCNSGE